MKKKIIIIAVSIIVLAMTVASATTAYFTDTDAAENVFTLGKVDISLKDYNKNYLGEEVALVDGKYNVGNLYPGIDYAKIPTITNEGPDDAYLAARITLKSEYLDNLFVTNAGTADEAVNVEELKKFLGGLVVDGTDYIVSFDPVVGEDHVIIVRVIKTAATTEGQSFELMQEICVDRNWNNDSMSYLKGLDIYVEAYGVQTVGFSATGAQGAITSAFPEAFPSANN